MSMDPASSGPSALNLAYVEALFESYQSDPRSVPDEWQHYFATQENGSQWPERRNLGPGFPHRSVFSPPAARPVEETTPIDQVKQADFQNRVEQLVRNYRVRGHYLARVDPLGLPRFSPQELTNEYFGFTEEEMNRRVHIHTVQHSGKLTLRGLLDTLRNTYTRSIGVEYMHIDDIELRRWLQRRMEGTENRLQLTRPEQLRILTRLTDAVIFEEFIRRKFIGAKSFSLEGCESLIPLLDLAIDKAAEQGVKEVIFGMAHRGRLNVLANIMGKSARQIFREFADKDPELYRGRGDVKYHLGHSNDWVTSTGKRVHLSLCFNPSHLEFVNPVAMGRARAKQDRVSDVQHEGCMPILIHGDAAFIGEGVVQESLNLSQLDGYKVGGVLHVIVNNQIGFTTSPSDARSGAYCTDIAKMLQSPIFHVNGEDPEAVAQVVRVALDFRKTFRRDVFIDMYGYRRLGHNETDEPSFTQPALYQAIEQRKTVREGYLEHLLTMGGVTREEADRIVEQRKEFLEKELSESTSEHYQVPKERVLGIWSRSSFIGGREKDVKDVDTGVAADRLAHLLEVQTRLPEGFTPHPKIARFLESRREMARGTQPLDWSAGEALAFATLATEGYSVRLSGQDCRRGTFSHRHAVLHDTRGGRTHMPLAHLGVSQAPVEIFNSPLSEIAVLGFDYGYSLECPDGLVLWEAQFGDFANAAQVIIDQFIVSAEDKWRRLSGLVMLLPHGFEGQGPEHSSARLERFLALSAEDNIQVAYPTTPAQFFHLLRRQVIRPWRKPLVVMTPKSLLRNAEATSPLQDFTQGTFHRILPGRVTGPKATRILLCTGKVYYDLERERLHRRREDVAILRLEQLYPLQMEFLEKTLAPFANNTPLYWVQEEPENMGSWRFMRALLGERLFGRFPVHHVSRPASASPATGSQNSHKQEQSELITRAFA
ncbi:MAG TPA: 2-oxoglutarate dehydrogenase E1 component [Verrucomicrobiales bacterium]|nr:2-oxoglutarate dehydrogenase E1 component [Verrucomicrobiales bacterium]